MTNRNIEIYRLVENTDNTVDAEVVKQLINDPYMISVDFKPCVIDVIVAVDNDFDNGSFFVDTLSENVSIKRSGNLIRIIVAPNYTSNYVDNIINFHHNVTGDTIPLLIRQTFQTYNLVLDVPECTDEGNYCCNYTFSYIAKDNRPIEKRDYKLRDNVFVHENEKEIITEAEYNSLTPSFNELDILQYVNNNVSSDIIYADEYSTMNAEEKSNYIPYRYIFNNNEYNDIKVCNIYEDQCIYAEDYVLYLCESETGETISAYEWSKLPIEYAEDNEGQPYYNIHQYIKTIKNTDLIVDKPRYFYNPLQYRITITNQQYNSLSDSCKNACVPVAYEHIYNDDIEISAEEYDNLSLNSQHYYKPIRYIVRDNNNKELCRTGVSSDVYDGYAIEGKYDYTQGNGGYYRDISAEEYENYPENGTSDYYIYQYVCIKSCQSTDYNYKVNDIIDFVDYEEHSLTDENFAIHRYGSGDFVKMLLVWNNVDNGKLITEEEFESLSEEEQSKYVDITIDGETFKMLHDVVTYDEFMIMSESEKENYQQGTETIDLEAYRTVENRFEYVPSEIITPSKFNSLPIYGKKDYVPYSFMYVDEDGNEYEINSQEYFSINLTRGDYVLKSVSLDDDEISLEAYNQLDDDEQGNYELCIRVNYIVNTHNEEYVPKCIIPINVKCFGGSYDFVVNGTSKYKLSDIQDYEFDDDNNIISNYTLVNSEEYIAEEPLFTYKKIKSNIFDDEDFIVHQLQLTSYGWIDSTFIEDSLNKDIFYRIKLSHKDVIGLEKTIRVILGIDYDLNELEITEPTLSPDDNPSNIGDPDNPNDDIYDGSDDGSDDETVEIIPSIEIENLVNNTLLFEPQGGMRAINIVTVPEDSAITFQYTSNIISEYRIEQHTIYIKVPKNKYGTEQSCLCKVINSEYPSCTVTFVLTQLGYQ